jgi:hypothetical protein
MTPSIVSLGNPAVLIFVELSSTVQASPHLRQSRNRLVDVDGKACGECEICKQPTQDDPVGYAAVDCSNVAGFEDLPTDCESVNEFMALGGCSAAHPMTAVIVPGFMVTIFAAVSLLLW